MRYELYYWPMIQGRGEFVRLALEDGGADYVDVARRSERSGMGMPAMFRLMDAAPHARQPFAPPFLKAGDHVIAQTANILQFLGPRLGLVPEDEAGRLWVHQLQLTIADLVSEAHDTHHPIASDLYYEEQKGRRCDGQRTSPRSACRNSSATSKRCWKKIRMATIGLRETRRATPTCRCSR